MRKRVKTINAQELTQDLQQFGNMVMGIAINYLKNAADAENITQEVFLKLFLTKKRFRSSEHKKAWLIRVTSNLCKDFLRSASRHSHVPLDKAADIPCFDKDMDGLLDLIRKLPMKYREVVYLHYYEGYTAKSIARMTGLSESNVAVRLHRARRLLKKEIERDGEYGGKVFAQRI
jgi:RNA polymerase sigma factor (sigma-70 family)